MDWVLNVFADNSDIARLIAVLVTGFFAIFVLLINQHFAIKKARKELLIKKVEDVYQCTMSYEKNAKTLLQVIVRGARNESGNFVLNQSVVDSMNDDVERLEMLMTLYFPEVKFIKTDYYAGTTLPVMEIAIKRKVVSEDEALSAAEDTREHIAKNVEVLKGICSSLMMKYAH